MGARRTALALVLVAVLGSGLVGSVANGAPSDRRDGGDAAGEQSPACGGHRPRRPTGGVYTCTFTENFSGNAIDTTKWVPQETGFSGMTASNAGCYVNSPRNLWVADGAAHVASRVEDAPFTCKSPYGDYTSQVTVAALTTATKFTQTYGRFEFRARFPRSTTPGLHSALWLYPARHSYGPWPKSGEIDVAEWWSARPSYVIPSVHYEGEPAPHSSGLCTMADPWNWHQYAVEWTPSFMRFLHDGVECFRHTWTPAAPLVRPQPFDRPFYVVLTQAFGSEWNAVTAETPRVATLEVDWVHAWQ